MTAKYVVLDLETTGLDPESDSILEVGAIACTQDLDVISTFWLVLHFAEEDVPKQTKFIRDMHTTNNLFRECAQRSPYEGSIRRCEQDFVSWLRRCGFDTKERKFIPVGHSPHGVDIPFIKSDLVGVVPYMSHRSIDIGSIGRFMRDVGGVDNIDLFKSEDGKHRAMTDAEGELAEMRRLRDWFRAHNKVTTWSGIEYVKP